MEAKNTGRKNNCSAEDGTAETERLGIPEIPLYVKETGSSNCVAII